MVERVDSAPVPMSTKTSSSRTLRLYGHRGASAELPENTLEAFRHALDQGANALEMDVHLTFDGHVVVSHDASGRRIAGVPREIRTSTLAEVQSWDLGFGFIDERGLRPYLGEGFRIPTIDEVLEAFPDVPLNVDIKQIEPPMVEPLLERICAHRAEERVCLASFSVENLERVRALGYKGPTALSRAEVLRLVVTPLRVLRRGLLPIVGERAQVPTAYGPVRFATRRFIEKCHALGVAVDFWTINDAELARRLVALGADGIMTDVPGRIAEAVGGPRKRAAAR